jgi:predicted transcriptional regulator
MKWQKAKDVLKENSQVVEELKSNEVEYEVIREIIQARKEKNLTQKELATLAGTKQSNISRLESGSYNPSLEFLTKITKAMGKQLEIRIV